MSDDPIADCLDGRISPEVALARLLLGGATAGRIAARLRDHGGAPSPRRQALESLLTAKAATLDELSGEIRGTLANHTAFADTPDAGIARIAAFFDRAVSHSPEASVALYSLGDPAILAAATAEILAWLERGELLRPDADVLDLGCGIGRMSAALAPRCRSVLGLDVSPGMVAEARRRHADLPNTRFETTSGTDLSALSSGSLDLVLAVDSFPYIVQLGETVIAAHLAGITRALRRSGALAILNLSYGRSPEADIADTARWAETHDMTLTCDGERPFQLWDGSAYVLRRMSH